MSLSVQLRNEIGKRGAVHLLLCEYQQSLYWSVHACLVMHVHTQLSADVTAQVMTYWNGFYQLSLDLLPTVTAI